MALTDKDITKLKTVFLTKEDAKAFLTKDDAKTFVTKEDAKAFATKVDLKALENRIMTLLDKIMKELEIAREDRIFAKAKDDEQDEKIKSLDKRVLVLEG